MCAKDYYPESVTGTAFFTGHRYLNTKEKPLIVERLRRTLLQAYDEGYRRFFCGCALGFDTVAAFQTVWLRNRYPDVILSLAIPCADQDKYWHEQDRAKFRQIMLLADEINILSPAYYQGAMLARNRYMADRSSLCICYLTRMRGGTASTVRYALLREDIRIVNLAVLSENEKGQMRENTWNCIFISPSVSKNADTVPLRLMKHRNLNMKHMSDSC